MVSSLKIERYKFRIKYSNFSMTYILQRVTPEHMSLRARVCASACVRMRVYTLRYISLHRYKYI